MLSVARMGNITEKTSVEKIGDQYCVYKSHCSEFFDSVATAEHRVAQASVREVCTVGCDSDEPSMSAPETDKDGLLTHYKNSTRTKVTC